MAAEADTKPESWSKIGSAYKGTTLLKRLYEAPAVEAFLSAQIAGDPQTRLLDIGCGVGKYLEAALNVGYKDVVGIDPAASMVEGCKTAMAEASSSAVRWSVLEASCLTMDADLAAAGEGAEFGAAMMVYVACNLGGKEEVKAAMVQSAKVLRKGGRLLIVDQHPFKKMDDYYTSEGELYTLTITMENGAELTFENRRYTLGFWMEAVHEAGLAVVSLKEPALAQDVFEQMGSPNNLKSYLTSPGLGMYLECVKL